MKTRILALLPGAGVAGLAHEQQAEQLRKQIRQPRISKSEYTAQQRTNHWASNETMASLHRRRYRDQPRAADPDGRDVAGQRRRRRRNQAIRGPRPAP